MNFWATLAVTLVALATASIVALSASGGADALLFTGTFEGSPASLWVNSTAGTGKLALTLDGTSLVLASAGLEAYTTYTTDPVSCEAVVDSAGLALPEAFFASGAFTVTIPEGTFTFGAPVAAGSDSISVPTVTECGAARERQLNQRAVAKDAAFEGRDLGAGISAVDLWQLSQACYGSRRGLGGGNPQGKNPPSGWGYVKRYNKGNAQGAILQKGGKYVAGYAGTDGINIFSGNTLGDWGDNLNIRRHCVSSYQHCWQTCSQHCSGWWRRRCRQSCRRDCETRCHHGKELYKGSYNYMNKLQGDINRDLGKAEYIVGHSLGGGAATIYAKLNPGKTKYGVASFGAPPTSFNSQCQTPGYRFFDNSDPIVGSIGVFGSVNHDVQNAVKCGEPCRSRFLGTFCTDKRGYQCRHHNSPGDWPGFGCAGKSEWGCDAWQAGINCIVNFASTHVNYHNHLGGGRYGAI